MRIGKSSCVSLIVTSLAVLMLSLTCSAGAAHAAEKSALDVIIENIVTGPNDVLHLDTSEESIYVRKMLRRFYKRRSFQPAWKDDNRLSKKANVLIEAIKKVNNQGLVPEYYHLASISNLMQREKYGKAGAEDLAMLDVLLTDAFLMLGCHFSAGCVNPVTVEAEWFLNRADMAVDIVLEDALDGNNLNESLSVLMPPQAEYFRLMNRFNKYRRIAVMGGWPALSSDKILKVGDHSKNIAELKDRLFTSGDLQYSGDGNVFDEDIEMAVYRFQERHGLKTDGIVGPSTFKALNVPVDARVKQMEVNLERMRWASRSMGHRYIVVNIADYNLRVIENSKTVMTMDVVVGKPYWDTPVFSKKMIYLVLNPSWKIPTNILKREILPKMKRKPEYLVEQGFRIYKGWSDDAEEIDPNGINWSEVKIREFKYKMRQDPGPMNPLGTIKFMMPNRFNIYLHDTPAQQLFSRNSRAFSHGCIRLKSPVELAQYLLQDDPEWSIESIIAAMDKGQELKVELPAPINVHVLYLTAWVDDNGILNFREDIYSRDERLYRAMKEIPEIRIN